MRVALSSLWGFVPLYRTTAPHRGALICRLSISFGARIYVLRVYPFRRPIKVPAERLLSEITDYPTE